MISREKPHIYRKNGKWDWEMACEIIESNGLVGIFKRHRHSDLNFQALEFVERLKQKCHQ